jgi:hypothetical protein
VVHYPVRSASVADYYGVIGNRDYIKYHGEKRPFWEFLDVHPAGWLSSLVYARKDTPEDAPMIWDCGAWSYRKDTIPKIGSNEVTAEWAFEQYQEYASFGDFIVAPDHMLIPDVDLDARRVFNRTVAKAFFKLAKSSGYTYTPMATAHGLTIDEKLDHTSELVKMGYQAIALGGLAGFAGSKRKWILASVAAVRAAFPHIHLHVMGISAPSYAGHWAEIGVNTFDGASHFKQAFTAGKYYIESQGQFTHYQATRENEEIQAPLCDCLACSKLREDGIDTRTYGSNENNMGRAAHNLNHLMRAITWAQSNPPSRQLSLFHA